MTTRKDKIGLPAGSLVYMGEPIIREVKVTISVFDYTEEKFQETFIYSLKELEKFKNIDTVTWINIDGIHDSQLVYEIGEIFGLHSLLLEDVVNSEHRPKIEEYEDHLHVTMKSIVWNEKLKSIDEEQISMVIGNGFVISFQEKPGDIFDPIRERIRNGKGRMRKMKADYLAYALIDVTVDHYFIIIEHLDNEIESLEKKIMKETDEKHIHEIQKLKKELLYLRKSIIPLREAVGTLEKGGIDLIEERTTYFLKDVYDHTVSIIDEIESYREMLKSLLELHLSGMNNRLNKVMKVLTVISTIFIPLTFIVGVYGMNFSNMPELKWKYGYLSVWILMMISVIVMIVILRRKKWM